MSRRGYESVLDIQLLRHFGDLPVVEVSAQAASTLDLELAKAPGVKAGTTKAKNTRNNTQIVLRSDLRSGSKHGYLNEVPGALPQLKRGGDRFPISRTTPRSPGLELSSPSQRRAFRYVHLLRGDLDEAAVRIGNMRATALLTPAAAPPSDAA